MSDPDVDGGSMAHTSPPRTNDNVPRSCNCGQIGSIPTTAVGDARATRLALYSARDMGPRDPPHLDAHLLRRRRGPSLPCPKPPLRRPSDAGSTGRRCLEEDGQGAGAPAPGPKGPRSSRRHSLSPPTGVSGGEREVLEGAADGVPRGGAAPPP